MAITTKLGRVGLVLKGAYSTSARYEKLDVVTYNGSSYAAKQATQGNDPPDDAYWQIMADASGAAAAATEARGAAKSANEAAGEAREATQGIDAKINTRLGGLSFAVNNDDGGLDIIYTY